ncbi:MAG: hypothetical protein AAGJ81_01485 [Verrucomicrobiota bacterium]
MMKDLAEADRALMELRLLCKDQEMFQAVKADLKVRCSRSSKGFFDTITDLKKEILRDEWKPPQKDKAALN